MRLRDTFAPLQNRNLAIYLSGQAVSLIGTWMQMTAQSWVVWRLSHAETALGLVGMLGTLPFLFLGPTAGVWADRFDRRKILIYTQAAAMVLAFALAALIQSGVAQLWHIYVLAAGLGCVGALDMPTQQAFIGDLAGMAMIRQAVVVNAMIVQVSRIFGPTLAGLVVRGVGEAPAFWINGLSFVAVILSLFAVRAQQAHRPRPGGNRAEAQFVHGVRFTLAQPRVLDLMIFTTLVTFFGFSNVQIFPAFVDETLRGDAGLLGVIQGASGVGALLSVLVVVPWAQQVKRSGQIIGIAVAAAGLSFALLSFARSPAPALAASFLSGIPVPVVLTSTSGLIQILAPGEMRARLLTLYLMVSFGAQPLASLWVGWLAHQLGAPLTLRIDGLAMLTAAILLLVLRSGLRDWEPAAAPRGPA